jgi:hypothetical protein
MSKVSAIRSSAKEDRASIPKPEEIFSQGRMEKRFPTGERQ